LFDKYVLDHAKVVHALTEQCLECLQHITTSPIVVVLNQVNDMQIGFNPVSLKQQICFIGRFDILRKGIDLALQSYKLYLKKRVDESAVSFTLIGPAKQQAEEESLRICEELNLEVGKDVVFTGKIALEDRNKILSESRVYMQLSRSEGFGLSIAQALCCYKPVIVSKQVPIHDKIIAYKGGFAVGNPEEASQALNTVFSLSDEDYKTMSMNARLCYEQEFHPSIIRPKLIQLYNAALEPSILSNR
jgi:glycosyltransferase involved in cell wall biosynthesis